MAKGARTNEKRDATNSTPWACPTRTPPRCILKASYACRAGKRKTVAAAVPLLRDRREEGRVDQRSSFSLAIYGVSQMVFSPFA